MESDLVQEHFRELFKKKCLAEIESGNITTLDLIEKYSPKIQVSGNSIDSIKIAECINSNVLKFESSYDSILYSILGIDDLEIVHFPLYLNDFNITYLSAEDLVILEYIDGPSSSSTINYRLDPADKNSFIDYFFKQEIIHIVSSKKAEEATKDLVSWYFTLFMNEQELL